MNENGLLSFLTEIPSYFNIEFPLDYPIIAILYSDVDCRGSGSIWFRTENSQELLQKAKYAIEASFENAMNFHPTELFIATWDQVGYFEEKTNKVNHVLQFFESFYIKFPKRAKCKTAIINIKSI